MLPFSDSPIRIVEYLDPLGHSPWARWFDHLSGQAAAMVTVALYRLAGGNFSNVKGVGAGVFERSIDSGPGYRIDFGKDGATLVLLLGGSTKRRQQEAIDAARSLWANYRHRKGGN